MHLSHSPAHGRHRRVAGTPCPWRSKYSGSGRRSERASSRPSASTAHCQGEPPSELQKQPSQPGPGSPRSGQCEHAWLGRAPSRLAAAWLREPASVPVHTQRGISPSQKKENIIVLLLAWLPGFWGDRCCVHPGSVTTGTNPSCTPVDKWSQTSF